MVRLSSTDRALIIDFETPRHIATTAHVKGLTVASRVAVYHVDESHDLSKPEELKDSIRAELGLEPEDPVMLTAADVSKYVHLEDGEYGVVATVGLSNPACPAMRALHMPYKGSTINVVAWVPDKLTIQAQLDLLRTVAEAKAAAAADLLLRCDGRATGTVSDALAVASFYDEKGYLWAGPSTTVGGRVASLTYRAITSVSRDFNEWLSSAIGMTLDDLVSDADALYRSAPVPGATEDAVRNLVRSTLQSFLADPNVWTFLVAARELDIIGGAGLIPQLGREEFEQDTKRVIADELLATALSLYLNGFKALTATYWADTLKRGLGLKLAGLPMFEDDIAAALVASALSRVYDSLLGGREGG
ncbi:MAG: adenosylcobinamide amidohydrolase [Acidilobus sp.]